MKFKGAVDETLLDSKYAADFFNSKALLKYSTGIRAFRSRETDRRGMLSLEIRERFLAPPFSLTNTTKAQISRNEISV